MKVGILGAGQLGRMLALAGIPLGIEFVFFDKQPQPCAAGLGEFIHAEFEDEASLGEFAERVERVTLEFESLPMAALQYLADKLALYPAARAVDIAQDRLQEKRFFTDLEIPTPLFYPADDAEQLATAVEQHGEPLVVKSRRWGYDGKGQGRLDNADQAASLWEALRGQVLLAEEQVHFSREVSLIAVRSIEGELRYYPLTENVHRNGILISSRPVENDPLQSQAEDYVSRVLNKLDYVGTLAFEFFDCDGQLYANEIAPRVHNSGHWSIEGAVTSQFENHLRAILGWPLGDTVLREPCIMYNCIGEMPAREAVLDVPHAHLHDYGKTPRAGRKLGHITLCAPDDDKRARIETCLHDPTA